MYFWLSKVPHSQSTEVGLIKDLLAVKNAPVNITAELNTCDCGETGMLFIAHRAVKIFILNSSNKWNFPLAEMSAFSLLQLATSQSECFFFSP